MMDKDEAWEQAKAVEQGDLPSGSVIVPITGPNSLLTPGISEPSDIDGSPKFKVPAYEGEDYSTSAIYEHLSELYRDRGTHGMLDAGDNPLGDNIKRAKFAAEAVRAYAKETGVYTGESIFLALGDFMNDVRHLLDFVGLDDGVGTHDGYTTDLAEMASRDLHYQAEIRGVF